VALVSPTDNSELLLSKQHTKFVVLHFLLKSECPFCLEVTHDYAKLQETMPDVLHVFLKPDDSNTIREWSDRIDRHDLQRNPIIYRDPDATLAKQFGIPDGYEFHGQSIHYPALVILDSSGKEIFRYVGKDNTDRMPASEFVQKLSAIESSG
jgi:peroxiredoxin Q/BCP